MNSAVHDFDGVYKAYFTKIHGYLSRMVGEFQAEDLAQEVFKKVHKGLPGFKGRSSLSTWIYRIATRTAIDRCRSRGAADEKRTASMEEKSFHQVGVGIMAEPPEKKFIKEEMNACIQEFIERLPYDYKVVLILSQYEQLKNREIAQVLNISLETAKVRLHRAKAKLKAELDAGCVFYYDDDNTLSCDRKQEGAKKTD